MNFAGYSKLCTILTESTKIEKLINNHFDPDICEKIMSILNKYSSSPLGRYIIKRLHNPQFSDPQKLVKNKIDQLEIYEYDKNLFNTLFDIKNENIKPGQLLISLTLSDKSKLNDISLENIGTVDICYLRNISKYSITSIPIIYDCENLYTYLIKLYNVIKEKPNILKRYLISDEISYFLDETIEEIENKNDISQKSMVLITKLIKNSQKNNDINLDWSEYRDILDKIVISNVKSENIMFLAPEGLYYILPKEKLHFYMFSGIENGNIKISPFLGEENEF